MKLLPLIVAAAITPIPAFAAPEKTPDSPLVAPYSEVIRKKTGKPIIVLIDGSEWAKESPVVANAFEHLAAQFKQSIACDFAIEDTKATGQFSLRGIRPAPWRVPAIYMLDPDGSTVAFIQGVNTFDEVKTFFDGAGRYADTAYRRIRMFDDAKTLTGQSKAEKIGQALDTLSYRMAKMRTQAIEDIRAADPQDSTGYVGKYTFNRERLHEDLNEALRKKDDKAVASVLARVDTLLRNAKFDAPMRQELHGVKFAFAKRRNDLGTALSALDDIIAEAKDSDAAVGARRIKELMTATIKSELTEWSSELNYDFPRKNDIGLGRVEKGDYELALDNRFTAPEGSTVTMTLNGAPLAKWKCIPTLSGPQDAPLAYKGDAFTWIIHPDWKTRIDKHTALIEAETDPVKKDALVKQLGNFWFNVASWKAIGVPVVNIPADGEVRVQIDLVRTGFNGDERPIRFRQIRKEDKNTPKAVIEKKPEEAPQKTAAEIAKEIADAESLLKEQPKAKISQ